MARAVLFDPDGFRLKDRGYRVPKRTEKIEAWSKAALKTFTRELGAQPRLLVKHTITPDEIRLGYQCGHGILIDRNASPLG